MKATIESTSRTMEVLDQKGRPSQVQVWEGVSESGVAFTAFIALITVMPQHASRTLEFSDELVRSRPPGDETLRAIARVRI